MSCTAEPIVEFSRDSGEPTSNGIASSISPKRKRIRDGEAPSSSDYESDTRAVVGRRKRARVRHDSTSAGVLKDSAIKTEQQEQEKERWKRRMSAKRTASISQRDPLGLDSTLSTPAPEPPSPEKKRIHFSGPYNNHKHRKDRVIQPPKKINRKDPLHLNEQIEAYTRKSQPVTAPDGTVYPSKREMMAERYRYGNYNRYYGYRSVTADPRQPLMRREWFEGKDCLDIGCNTGQFTLAMTRDFAPRMMIGIDIDKELVRMAKRNIRHYLTADVCAKEGFPKSLPILYGPIAAPVLLDSDKNAPREFPYNVAFLQCDYVPASPEVVEKETEEFDTVLALSITKWIHVNWGDDGLKRFFKRVFRHLKPGGVFIMEPQEWSSYCTGKSKGKFTIDMRQNYLRLHLRPEKFEEYLLSAEVGFAKSQKITLPSNANVTQGFKRSMFLFTKGGDSNADQKPVKPT